MTRGTRAAASSAHQTRARHPGEYRTPAHTCGPGTRQTSLQAEAARNQRRQARQPQQQQQRKGYRSSTTIGLAS